MLEARNISFSYDGTTPVLDLLDFQVKRGEIVVITGSTGSGKSTLAKCLSGFIPHSIQGEFSGSVLIDNSSMSELPIAEIARQIALVQQDPESQICTLQVSDEVAFGPENYNNEVGEISTLVESSLESVGANHLYDRATFELSGGEKQRLIIASMTACKPDFLILDEPSSSLDPRGVIQLQRILKDLKNQNIGVIVIEHNTLAIQPVADRVLTLSDGKITTSDIPRRKDLTKFTPSKFEDTESPLLTASNLEFSYGVRKVINNVSLNVHKGEVVGLMGSNGSGKTTLLGLLGGLLTPENGKIHLKGTPLGKMKTKEIAHLVATVFQNPNHQIFEKTVWNEQILTLKALDLDTSDLLQQAENSLEKAGINDLKDRNPFSLSHGQKRRLNVSSIIVHKPEVLLLDEPFIGQDMDGRQFIRETVLETTERGGAALIVTHDPAFVQNHCDRAIFMEEGSILLDGPPSSVLERLKTIDYKEYADLGVQP
ncbi:MAG: putative HMP/thiamine import ATP-binding protein YkoD [Candidatus Thorarchaeota archaeon AB_25]|nr:MAG: putative HMP/thiamine import ATP-binding protein YkoD [Candidatus Thorarchaeota archaeon AB_25]